MSGIWIADIIPFFRRLPLHRTTPYPATLETSMGAKISGRASASRLARLAERAAAGEKKKESLLAPDGHNHKALLVGVLDHLGLIEEDGSSGLDG